MYQNLGKKVEKLESDAIFCEKSICVFPNCQTQYIIDEHSQPFREIHRGDLLYRR